MVTSLDEPINQYRELTAWFCEGVAGDQASYARFLQAVAMLLRWWLGKRLPDSDVEEVLQEILISVHKARHTYDGKRPLIPWLFAIAHFRVSDHWRKFYAKARFEMVDIDTLSETLANVTETDPEHESMDESVYQLLKHIPEREQHILTLMHVEGYTAKETGKQLGMNESAVKVAAHRAIKKIREKLGIEPER